MSVESWKSYIVRLSHIDLMLSYVLDGFSMLTFDLSRVIYYSLQLGWSFAGSRNHRFIIYRICAEIFANMLCTIFRKNVLIAQYGDFLGNLVPIQSIIWKGFIPFQGIVAQDARTPLRLKTSQKLGGSSQHPLRAPKKHKMLHFHPFRRKYPKEAPLEKTQFHVCLYIQAVSTNLHASKNICWSWQPIKSSLNHNLMISWGFTWSSYIHTYIQNKNWGSLYVNWLGQTYTGTRILFPLI